MGWFNKITDRVTDPLDHARDMADRAQNEVNRIRDRAQDAADKVLDSLPGVPGGGNPTGVIDAATQKLRESKIVGISKETFDKFVDAYKRSAKYSAQGLRNLLQERGGKIPRLVEKGLKLYNKLIRRGEDKREALEQALAFVAGKVKGGGRDSEGLRKAKREVRG